MKIIAAILLTLYITYTPAQTKLTAGQTAATPSDGGGYRINITLKPLQKQWVYLGCYFGKYKNLIDSTFLNNNSEGVFFGKKKLPQGIYFIITGRKVLLFDFFMDKTQQFSLQADTLQPSNYTVEGSMENTHLKKYNEFLSAKAASIDSLQKQVALAKTKQDTLLLQERFEAINTAIEQYRKSFYKKYPKAMLSTLFMAMKRPTPPSFATNKQLTKNDTIAAYRYVKDHWWDDVAFDDGSLVRTPFFDAKIDDYFKYYVPIHPDSIFSEISYIMLLARPSEEMTHYLLGKFTDKYINPEYMGLDKVFVSLYNNYFSKGDTAWLSPAQNKYIFERAYFLMSNIVGNPAPELNLTDTAGNKNSLYAVDAKLTFLVFWDPNCGHCQEALPQIDSFYRASWKNLGLKMYAVNIDPDSQDAWKKFINKHRLTDWINVYQPRSEAKEQAEKNLPSYKQLYDITQTPRLYLLDDKKRIIAKNLTASQMNEIIKIKAAAK